MSARGTMPQSASGGVLLELEALPCGLLPYVAAAHLPLAFRQAGLASPIFGAAACGKQDASMADAIVTRNRRDFGKSSIKVFDCDGLFACLAEEKGLVYDEIPW